MHFYMKADKCNDCSKDCLLNHTINSLLKKGAITSETLSDGTIVYKMTVEGEAMLLDVQQIT